MVSIRPASFFPSPYSARVVRQLRLWVRETHPKRPLLCVWPFPRDRCNRYVYIDFRRFPCADVSTSSRPPGGQLFSFERIIYRRGIVLNFSRYIPEPIGWVIMDGYRRRTRNSAVYIIVIMFTGTWTLRNSFIYRIVN